MYPAPTRWQTREAEISVRYLDGRLSSSFMYGVFDQIEIGVNNIRANGDTSDLGIVLKGTAVQETADSPAIAVGFETGQGYVVASKRLAPWLRGHAGFGYGDLEGLLPASRWSSIRLRAVGARRPPCSPNTLRKASMPG